MRMLAGRSVGLGHAAHRPRNVLGADELHDELLRPVYVGIGISRYRVRRDVVAVALGSVRGKVDDKVCRRTIGGVRSELHPDGFQPVGRPVVRRMPRKTARAGLDLVSDVACERELKRRAYRGVLVTRRRTSDVRLDVREHDCRLAQRIRHVDLCPTPFSGRHGQVGHLRRRKRLHRGGNHGKSRAQRHGTCQYMYLFFHTTSIDQHRCLREQLIAGTVYRPRFRHNVP